MRSKLKAEFDRSYEGGYAYSEVEEVMLFSGRFFLEEAAKLADSDGIVGQLIGKKIRKLPEELA